MPKVVPISTAMRGSRARIANRAPAPAAASPAADPIVHNLNGQRLGRKGRDTRERIVAVTHDMLSDPDYDGAITMSEVARRAAIRIGTLYLYFADLTELMLAVLEPVMATVEDEYVHLVREYWPDAELHERSLQFVEAYFGFWTKHSNLLHQRNSMADRGDERMLAHRVRSAIPVMRLIVTQMGTRLTERGTIMSSTATALMTGLERVATVMTDMKVPFVLNEAPNPLNLLLEAEARLFELAIRDQRQHSKQTGQE